MNSPTHLFCALLLACPTLTSADEFAAGTPNAFTIEFVDIDRGNEADDTGYGAVPYDYRMAIHEITRSMIEAHNSLNGNNPITLADMTAENGNGPNHPATGISWYEARDFVNWLNTSSGYPPAYSGSDIGLSIRDPRARYFLPSEDEWYKAGYYDPSTSRYYDYANGSDTPGGAVINSTSPAEVSNSGTLSPYGTRGQNGNALEWMESALVPPFDVSGEARAIRGGFYGGGADLLHSSYRRGMNPAEDQNKVMGFRVASVFQDRDGDSIPDEHETNTGVYASPTDTGSDPDNPDTDGDGIGDWEEIFVHGSNPTRTDSDGDGFEDPFEINTGFDPASAISTPDLLSEVLIAIEFRFNAANGDTYKIESSTDLETWTTEEMDIAGAGDTIVRFYTIEAHPKRYFRARKQ